MSRLEPLALLAGMGLIALSLALVDVRLGLAALGLCLIVSVVDFRGVRR